eukprot:765330-Hanusia_phi.AAC.1
MSYEEEAAILKRHVLVEAVGGEGGIDKGEGGEEKEDEHQDQDDKNKRVKLMEMNEEERRMKQGIQEVYTELEGKNARYLMEDLAAGEDEEKDKEERARGEEQEEVCCEDGWKTRRTAWKPGRSFKSLPSSIEGTLWICRVRSRSSGTGAVRGGRKKEEEGGGGRTGNGEGDRGLEASEAAGEVGSVGRSKMKGEALDACGGTLKGETGGT